MNPLPHVVLMHEELAADRRRKNKRRKMENAMDKRVFLKVKVKALAAEARIIRKEEHRSRYQEALYLHRIHVVRRTARTTLLAYGFVRGRTYESMEKKCRIKPNWKEVETLVKRYGVAKRDDENQMEFNKRKQEQEDKLVAWVKKTSKKKERKVA